jgi:alpha-tubulin suppressor-like RCC1 family protein
MWAAPAFAAPRAPNEVRAIATGANQVALSWSKATGGEAITAYEVLRNGARAGTVDGYTTTFLDTGLTSGAKYIYTVIALDGTERSAPNDQPQEAETAASAQVLEHCTSSPLGAGNYVLDKDIVVPPGHPCFTFQSTEGVSFDCHGHTVSNEMGALNNEAALVMQEVEGFAVVNCAFDNPDPVNSPTLVSVSNSAEGIFENDSFVAGQNQDTLRLTYTLHVAFAADTLTNVPVSESDGVGDYFGNDTITEPSQAAGDALDFSSSWSDTIDGNRIDGDASLKGYEPELSRHWYPERSSGADDVIMLEAGNGDEIVNNQILDSYDCGIETTNLASGDTVLNNILDDNWAAGVCSYYATSYRANAFVDNIVSYAGTLFAFGGSGHELAHRPGGQVEAENYLYGNLFEGNVLMHGAWHIWDYSSLMTPWNEQALHERLKVGNNAFVNNDFGGSLPAPYVNAVLPENGLPEPAGAAPEPGEPFIVGHQSGNECQAPSTYLECAPPPASTAARPSVVGVYPNQGPVSGGTTVAIEGSGLNGASEVLFGERRAVIKRDVEDTRLLVQVPEGQLGLVDVSVVTPNGASSATRADQFAYGNAPFVSSVSGNAGPAAGGTTVAITGSGFSGASSVNFGPRVELSCETAAPPCFTANSSSAITARSPAAASAGSSVNVTVSGPGGTSATDEGIAVEGPETASDRFWYAPAVTKLATHVGTEAGETVVRIYGEHLEGATAVMFGGHPAKSFEIEGATEIVARSPGASAGVVDVTVTTPGGTSAAAPGDRFTDGAPVVTGIKPETGRVLGGASVTIVGERLEEVGAVYFGAQPAAFEAISPSEVVAIAPAGSPGTVDVTARTPGGTSPTGPSDHFTYLNAPSISSIGPVSGPEAGGTSVAIHGTQFEHVSAVKFGLVSVHASVTSASEIVAVAPRGSGAVNVSVVSTGGASPIVPADRFTYTLGSGQGLPAVSGVQANGGPEAGGTRVVISGAHLGGASTVLFGSASAQSVTVDSPSMITATAPTGTPGTVDVRVVTPEGTSAPVPADSFTYRRAFAPVGWGDNSYSRLGDESAENRSLPVQAGLSGEAVAVAGGEAFTLALLKEGRVEAYGANNVGQLGDETTEGTSRPVAISGLSEVVAIAAGTNFGLALRRNGTVMAWGENNAGELGDGNQQSTAAPVAVKGLTEVVAIAAGTNFGLALCADGAVMAWGGNYDGQLGDGTDTTSNVPVEVSGLSEVAAVAAGGQGSFALLRNGTVDSWGANRHGLLGNGTEANTDVPSEVPGLSEVTALAAGNAHALALLRSGKVEAWGWNLSGQLGVGDTTNRSAPVEVTALGTDVAALAAGSQGSLALMRDGTLRSWGDNRYGQLGDGTTTGPESCVLGACSKLPVSVSELSGAASIGAGEYHDVATGVPAPRVTRLSPSRGWEAGGTSVTIHGADLDATSEVWFGQTKVPFTQHSQSTITASAPPGTGVADVTVRTPAGMSQAGPADQFSYVVPMLEDGIGFESPVGEGTALAFGLRGTGSGVSTGPLKAFGSPGETANVQMMTPEPAFEEINPGHFRATGGGVNSEVEGRTATGSRVIGPLTVACSVPASVVLAELPIQSTTNEANRQYTASYSSQCMLAPGVLDAAGIAKISLTTTGPTAIAPDAAFTLTGMSFTITPPLGWQEDLLGIGVRKIVGRSKAYATVVTVGEVRAAARGARRSGRPAG